MQIAVKQTKYFDRSPQEVWEYLTRPELIEQWLMKSDFKPIAGHKFRFTHVPKNESDHDGITHCEVLEVKPFTKLSYSWKGSAKDGGRVFNSIVVWTLISKNNGTELQLQHDGFDLPEDVIAHDTGWNFCLKRFEELINTSI